ncbi:hypothetical protein M233_06410 [Xylella fastidiosa subsp. multiplex Griffin-1]|nr:hypothetical protein M233_06410 [Xylella fastidiosa subsp. multiplex Griffin-1]
MHLLRWAISGDYQLLLHCNPNSQFEAVRRAHDLR